MYGPAFHSLDLREFRDHKEFKEYKEYNENKQYQQYKEYKGIDDAHLKTLPRVKRASSSQSTRSKPAPPKVPTRATKPSSSSNSSPNTEIRSIPAPGPPRATTGSVPGKAPRTRHCSSNLPAGVSRSGLSAFRRSSESMFSLDPHSTAEPVPVYKYSSSDESLAEPISTKQRKKKPRNALRLGRTNMETFSPLHTSEKIDLRTKSRISKDSSFDNLTTLPTMTLSSVSSGERTRRSPQNPPPHSPPPPPPTHSPPPPPLSPRKDPPGPAPRTDSADLSTAFQNLQAQTDTLSRQFRDLETDVRTNSRDLGNLQESLVKVASDRDMKDIIKRVSTQTSSMLSEFRDTQRNVAKCLSEAEQARKDYIMFKEKTEAILFQLQQSLLMNGVNGSRISSRLSLEKGSENIESNEDRNI